ncbi:DUF4270 family protein [Flagellimonas aequoris]|uniref:DUF4270 domain-containing protein n=1 Tax=Flagellimonas aequoris TaxID=2306997 RepID=A0A418N8K9_9FLAO|nr:DUF4270 family protein [Allomuricauda aequoris]RIV71941.1 DUF4270 family protein [Allomuricauda aequoris]TXK03710.1 DUF4270 domain-containing protein [Allomuricauda aequoris]
MERILVLLIAVALMAVSCSSDNFNTSDFLAGEAFTDSNLRVVLVDTLTVDTSTMKFDSIVSSESTRILVGKYIDPVFGTVKTSSYMGMLPSSFSIDSEAEYDSIALYLKLDKYYYNDTLRTNTIKVKRLTKTLRPREGDYIYNTDVAEYMDEDLAIFTYNPRPLASDTLEIRLMDELGTDLFTKFQEKEITSSDQFKDYFRGIALLPGDDDNGSVIGFSKTSGASYMRIYFSTAEEDERVQDYLDINLDVSSDPTPFFNQILAENPIAPLQTLTDKEINLSSADADNLSFVQSGIGITTRVQIPYLKTLYDIKGQGTLLDAVLKIKPATGTFDDHLILRDTLSVYIVNQNNDLTSQLLIGESNPVYGILNRDDEEFNNIYYEISLGSYLEGLLTTDRDTDDALILLPDNYNSTVDRFILTGMDGSEFSTVLELIYAIYDEDDE